MEKVENYCIVYCNTDSNENAELIANSLITDKLAACVSIIPKVISIYTWENQIDKRNEYMLMVKTALNKLDLIEKKIKELHNDNVPEIISIKIENISKDYLNWMEDSLK